VWLFFFSSSESSEVQDNASIAATVTKSSLTFDLLDGSSQVVELPNFISKVDYQGIIGALSFVEKTKIALEELANIFIQNSKNLLYVKLEQIPVAFINATINLELTSSLYVAYSDDKISPIYIQLPPRSLQLTFPYLADSVIEGSNDKSKSILSFNIACTQLLPYFFGSFTSKIQPPVMTTNMVPMQAISPQAISATAPQAATTVCGSWIKPIPDLGNCTIFRCCFPNSCPGDVGCFCNK